MALATLSTLAMISAARARDICTAVADAATGKGLMHEALVAAISHVFEVHKLHRIMANYQPNNQRSEKLLCRLGFEREGLAKRYLKINGLWADHVLSSLINPAEGE